MRVMFVDDEPTVLKGIERMLSILDKDWEAVFETSSEQALVRLAERPADIVVSDMEMPAVDGANLLTKVQQEWPQTLRVGLSAQTDDASTLKGLTLAHQFIAKPCDSRQLIQSLERILSLQDLLQSDAVRRVVGRIDHLPVAPRMYMELTQLLADDEIGIGQIATVVWKDPALAATVLHLANSAFFNRGKPAEDVRSAVVRIGVNTLRLLVLTTEVFGRHPGNSAVAALQERALIASQLVRRMTARREDLEVAQTAALLAHVGLLIPDIERICAETATAQSPAIDHVQIGAYLLGLWGLSLGIVEAVAHHAHPGRASWRADGFGVVGLVHVAVALADGREPDMAYLQSCGVAEHLPRWRDMHAELVQSV